MSNQLTEKDALLRFASAGVRGPPSEQLKAHRHPRQRPQRERAYPIVKDVVGCRADGRPAHPEPLDAFADEPDRLGYRHLRLWWTQIVAELRVIDPSSAPISASVLATALVEGALTFIVSHARKNGQFQSSDYKTDPQRWKIENLVASACLARTRHPKPEAPDLHINNVNAYHGRLKEWMRRSRRGAGVRWADPWVPGVPG